MIDPGKLENRIELCEAVIIKDELSGQPLDSQNTVGSCWAEVIYQKISEIQKADFELNVEIVQFIIWYRPDVNEKMQIRYDGDMYEIKAIAKIGRREGLNIRAVKKID